MASKVGSRRAASRAATCLAQPAGGSRLPSRGGAGAGACTAALNLVTRARRRLRAPAGPAFTSFRSARLTPGRALTAVLRPRRPCIFQTRLCDQVYRRSNRSAVVAQQYQAAGWRFGRLSPCELFQRIRCVQRRGGCALYTSSSMRVDFLCDISRAGRGWPAAAGVGGLALAPRRRPSRRSLTPRRALPCGAGAARCGSWETARPATFTMQ